MNVFDELNQFLEDRLEEFLQANPHLELLALDEQLAEQQTNAQRSLTNLKTQEQQIQSQILDTAKEVELWHHRANKAEAAQRLDLANPAREREAALFRQGNQLWGQMQGVQQQIQTLESALQDLSERRAALKEKIKAAHTAPPQTDPQSPWTVSPPPPKNADPLETVFQQWETDLELEELKKTIKP